MMKHTYFLLLTMTAAGLVALAGCEAEDGTAAATAGSSQRTSTSSDGNVMSASMLSDHARNRARQYEHPGFVAFADDGRLWVFAEKSDGLKEYLQSGEPAKSVTWIGAGPNGMSLRSDDADVLAAYTAAKPGFATYAEEGRLWVFQAGSEGHKEFLASGEPAKSVTWIGAGPRGMSMRSDDADTLLSYLAAKPGFSTYVEDGRIWVFQTGSEGHQEYQRSGEPAKSVTWIGAGPRGVSLRSDSADALLSYVASKPGFRVFVEDERLWVFRDGSEALNEFLEFGEPAKSVTLIGVGPRGASLRGADRETLHAYLSTSG